MCTIGGSYIALSCFLRMSIMVSYLHGENVRNQFSEFDIRSNSVFLTPYFSQRSNPAWAASRLRSSTMRVTVRCHTWIDFMDKAACYRCATEVNVFDFGDGVAKSKSWARLAMFKLEGRSGHEEEKGTATFCRFCPMPEILMNFTVEILTCTCSIHSY